MYRHDCQSYLQVPKEGLSMILPHQMICRAADLQSAVLIVIGLADNVSIVVTL